MGDTAHRCSLEDLRMRMAPVIKTYRLDRSIRSYTEVLDFTWKWPEYAEAEIANGIADLTNGRRRPAAITACR